MTRILGLTHHLGHHHLPKQGLRLWFSQHPEQSFDDCVELGARYGARLAGFQVDRATLDTHLLEEAVKAGCELIRPAKVTSLQLHDGGEQVITLDFQNEQRTIRARWAAMRFAAPWGKTRCGSQRMRCAIAFSTRSTIARASSPRGRLLIALLTYLGPLLRSLERYRWLARGLSAFEPISQDRPVRTFPVPWWKGALSVAFWTEDGLEKEVLLQGLQEAVASEVGEH